MWHRIQHKASGEVQIVASLGGIDESEWNAVPLKTNRAPTEFQIVNEDGSVTLDKDARTKAERRVKLAAMPIDELVDMITNTLIAPIN